MSVGLVLGMGQFCWQVEINGANPDVSDQIRQTITKAHCVGKSWTRLDFSQLTSLILDECENVGLVSFTRRGGALIVNYSDKTAPIDVSLPNYEGIRANADGIVSRMFVEEGTPLVKEGDTVHMGQMLIAPYAIVDDKQVPSKAKGRVKLYIWNSVTLDFCENSQVLSRTGESQTVVSVMWKDEVIVDKKDSLFDNYETEERVVALVGGPIKIIYTKYYELEQVEVYRKFEDEKDSLIWEAREKMLTIVDESDIIDEKVSISQRDDIYYLTFYVKTEIEV